MKNKIIHPILACVLALGATSVALAQDNLTKQKDSITQSVLDEIVLSAIVATDKTPVAFENLSKKQLATKNLGQDLPTMMAMMTSVVTTTDAGNGVGYSSFRVRGSDATRVNVTLNGIPYNDSESQGSFWVNMPDFTSSVQNLQLQRGVGTSTNGAAAFGASLNLQTDNYSYDPKGEVSTSFGSYNTHKYTVKLSSGLIDNKFEISGRLSDIKSDGYVDRASSDLKSYYLQGVYVGNTTLLKAITFGGKQKTYQAWNGVDKEQMELYGRRFNTSGMYFDDDGKMQFYDNETDNYTQDHYQLHWTEKWSDNWSSNLSLHYTKGNGYFENYKMNDKLQNYGLPIVNVEDKQISRSDIIRTKSLNNHFYGTVFNVNYTKDKVNLILGGAVNKYQGDHYGNILWVKQPVDFMYNQEYYRNESTKVDMSFFSKLNYQFNEQFSLYVDLQYRQVHYKANAIETGLVDDTFGFFNPKAGLIYDVNSNNQLYFSYARASREPSRNDYEGLGKPKAEKLDDYELGWRFKSERASVNVNAYLMNYKDQLVLTGELNDTGASLRANSGSSYRLGLEVDANLFIVDKLIWSPSVSLSTNRNRNYKALWLGEQKDFGNTAIAFSPDFIASSTLSYLPLKGMSVSLLTRYVSSQYMSNLENENSKLNSYFVNDLNISYTLDVNSWLKSVEFSLLANNLFNVKYISNGYYWSDFDGTSMIDGAGYYPQAEFNILAGVTFKF
ncbi:TonB-dependent receptor [Myroides sp. LJL115]